MGLLQKFRCMRGDHLRSRGSVRHVDGAFHSVCRGCGEPMVRDIDGWVLESVAKGRQRVSKDLG